MNLVLPVKSSSDFHFMAEHNMKNPFDVNNKVKSNKGHFKFICLKESKKICWWSKGMRDENNIELWL